MKNKKVIAFIGAVFLLAACNKVKIAPVSEFDVSVNKTTCKVGDSVVFSFTGDPNNINFYSGEPTHIYAYRNRYAGASAVNNLTFTSNCTATGQTGNLSVLISTNFSGITDSTNIRNASWTDITSRAVLSANTTNTPSGTINLSDFQTAADSLFVAYRYTSTPSTSASRARAWTVGSFVFTNVFPDGTSFTHNTVSTDARYGGFQAATLNYDSAKWAVGGSLTFPQGTIGQTKGDEDWAVSKSFKLFKMAPDVSVNIKTITQFVSNYVYKYTKAGVYTVVFVASNIDTNGSDSTTRTLTLTVTN